MTIYAVTGHRPQKLGGYTHDIRTALEYTAEQTLAICQPGDQVITGMALGWDQAIASACIHLHIPFIAAVPFWGQETLWPEASQRSYKFLLGKAISVVTVCQGNFTPAKMQWRNEWMVDHADEIIALWDGSTGGTANCVRYANQKHKPVINVYPAWLQIKERMCVS